MPEVGGVDDHEGLLRVAITRLDIAIGGIAEQPTGEEIGQRVTALIRRDDVSHQRRRVQSAPCELTRAACAQKLQKRVLPLIPQ